MCSLKSMCFILSVTSCLAQVPTLFGPVTTSMTNNYNGADIVFILDGSGSVQRSRFKEDFSQFIYDISSRLTLGPNAYQVAVVQFGNIGRTEIKLDELYNAEQIRRFIANNVTYMDENTNTTGGLLQAREVLDTDKYGARNANWAKIGLLLTDGQCTRDCFRLSTVSESLKMRKINMLSIGIGNNVDNFELATIAANENEVINVQTFNDLPEQVTSVITWIENVVNNTPHTNTTDSSEKLGGDVVFLVDSSESITERVFQDNVLRFVTDTTSLMPIGPDTFNVAVMTYGEGMSEPLKLSSSADVNTMGDQIGLLPHHGDMTNTSGALSAFRSLVKVSDWRSTSRQDMPIIGVLITDGRPTVNAAMTLPEAMRAKQDGISLIVMAVGEDGDVEEDIMMAAASDPASEHYMRLNTFDELNAQGRASQLVNTVRNIAATVPTQQGTTTTTSQPGPIDTWICDFEDENEPFCDMTQSTRDDFDWTRAMGWTPSFETGPYSAHNGMYYIFIEASNKQQNDRAAIFLPQFQQSDAYCVGFAYHMFGFHIRRLELIRMNTSSQQEVLWQKEGNQNSQWNEAKVQVTVQNGDQIGFVGITGEAFTGDIALDDISMTRGPC